MQRAVGPFDCLFESPRGEMSDSHLKGGEKSERIERAQRRARSRASIATSGWLRDAWIFPLASQARAAFGLSARARSRAAAAIAASPARRNSVRAEPKSFRRHHARLRAPVGPGGKLRRCPHPTVLPTPEPAEAPDTGRPKPRPAHKMDRSPRPV